MTEKRKFRLEVRLEENEGNELRKRALVNRMSISDYVRRTVFSEKFTRIATDYETIIELKMLHADLNRMGNFLLEQKIQKKIGLENSFDLREAVKETLDDLKKLRELILKTMIGIAK